MNHRDALDQMAVERYLLGELSGAALETFEEHLFECSECAMDLGVGTTFIDAARKELKTPAKSTVPRTAGWSRWASWFASPGILAPALAACLAVVAVESFVVLPRMRGQLEQTGTPAVVNNLVLANAGARGDSIAKVVAPKHGSFLITVDIPAKGDFSGYLCSLYSPDGTVVWQTTVSPQQASDALLIHMPTDRTREGLNTLVIQGLPVNVAANGKVEDLARYKFQVAVSQ